MLWAQRHACARGRTGSLCEVWLRARVHQQVKCAWLIQQGQKRDAGRDLPSGRPRRAQSGVPRQWRCCSRSAGRACQRRLAMQHNGTALRLVASNGSWHLARACRMMAPISPWMSFSDFCGALALLAPSPPSSSLTTSNACTQVTMLRAEYLQGSQHWKGFVLSLLPQPDEQPAMAREWSVGAGEGAVGRDERTHRSSTSFVATLEMTSTRRCKLPSLSHSAITRPVGQPQSAQNMRSTGRSWLGFRGVGAWACCGRACGRSQGKRRTLGMRIAAPDSCTKMESRYLDSPGCEVTSMVRPYFFLRSKCSGG